MFEKLDKFPPCVVRLLARKCNGRQALSSAEIAKAGGLPKSTVIWLSKQISWDKIHVGTIKRFFKGCRVDFEHMAHHREFLSKRLWVHINSPRQKKFFDRLLSLRGNK